MQKRGLGPQGHRSTMSHSIWKTLTLSLSFLGRDDLHSYAENKDLERLNKEFNVDT